MNADAVTADNYAPPAWLAQPGYSKAQLMWLADKLMERLQAVQIENRALRGLPPTHNPEDTMTTPAEFIVSNPVHRQRLLAEGGTVRAVPARMQNPAGADILGIALIDAAGQPRILADRTAAFRLYDTLTEILGLDPEHDHEETN